MINERNALSTVRDRDAGDPQHLYCRCMKSAFFARSRHKAEKREREEANLSEPMRKMLGKLTKAERKLLLAQLEQA